MALDPFSAFRDDIANPSRGPAIAAMVAAEVAQISVALQSDDVGSPGYSEEELVRRATALAAATERLGMMSAFAGRWAAPGTALLWPPMLSALLDVRDRGNGLPPWLQLLLYPALIVEYAFGLGASIGRRSDSLALILTAPTMNERKEWQPAVIQLGPHSLDERIAIKLQGAKARWPLSEHLLSVVRPWFAEIVPSNALLEREFDRFEVLLSLVHFDIARGEAEQAWFPIGRFARHGRWDRAIYKELFAEARQGDTTSVLLGALASGDHDRLAGTMAAFEGHVQKILAHVW